MTEFRTFKKLLPFRKDLVVGILVLLLAGSFAAWHVSDWPVKLRYPGDESLVEGVPLAEMVHLRQGVPIYAPPTPERFDAAIYGPLYFLLGSRLVNADEPAYLPLRALSLLGTLGCAAGCALLAFWVSRSYFAAALAPLVFLSYGFVTTHGISARADLVALLLFFSGFLIAYRFRQSRVLLAATPLIVLGVYYKQQFVAGPLAVFLFLLLEKRYRLAAEFAGLMALGGLGLLAVFEWVVFPGQGFLRHFVVYNMLPFSWFKFSLGGWQLGLMFFVPLLLALEFLRVKHDKLLTCYLGCTVVLSLVTSAKAGSDSNYFLECALVLSALVASLVARSLSGPQGVSEILVLLGVMLFFGQWFAPGAPRAEDFARDRAVQEFLRSNFAHHARALGYYPGDLLRAGLDTPVTDPFQYSQLVFQGRLPDRNLLMELNGRSFAVIVAHYDLRDEGIARHRIDRLPDSWGEAILQNYQLQTTIEMPRPERLLPEDRFYVWVPRLGPQGAGAQSTP
jgi:hypothetical protein